MSTDSAEWSGNVGEGQTERGDDSGSSGVVSEGQAEAYLPKGVFYNPVQEFNRDLTVLVITEYERLRHQEKVAMLKKKPRKSQTPGNTAGVWFGVLRN